MCGYRCVQVRRFSSDHRRAPRLKIVLHYSLLLLIVRCIACAERLCAFAYCNSYFQPLLQLIADYYRVVEPTGARRRDALDRQKENAAYMYAACRVRTRLWRDVVDDGFLNFITTHVSLDRTRLPNGGVIKRHTIPTSRPRLSHGRRAAPRRPEPAPAGSTGPKIPSQTNSR